MLELIYTSPHALARIKRCWLYDAIDEYLTHLASQGYSSHALRHGARDLRLFADFVAKRGRRSMRELPRWAGQFIDQNYRPDNRSRLARHFVDYLRQMGLIPPAASQAPVPRFFKYVTAYERFLNEQRGLSSATVEQAKRYCVKFLCYIHREGVRKISMLNRRIIHQFVTAEAQHYGRHSMTTQCSTLRNFLSFLHVSGSFRADLAPAVVTPEMYKHERCPRFLSRAEIEAVLSAVDRRIANGKRNYLGHRHPDTTQRYLKIDLTNLRDVAINDGEEML